MSVSSSYPVNGKAQEAAEATLRASMAIFGGRGNREQLDQAVADAVGNDIPRASYDKLPRSDQAHQFQESVSVNFVLTSLHVPTEESAWLKISSIVGTSPQIQFGLKFLF